MWDIRIFGALLSSIQLAIGTGALKFFRLDVPGAIFSGDPVWLGCQFDAEGDSLYSVKWYKNNEEFFRFLPRDAPKGQKYDLLGVYVDLNLTNQTHVYLQTTDLNTEGTFACEVSEDAPSFRTFKAEKDLRVYVVPTKEPKIHGMEGEYSIGDDLNLTCAAGPAKPAPVLRWYVNGAEAFRQDTSAYPPVRHTDGLLTSRLGLLLSVEPSLLVRGTLKVQCQASISQVYSKTSDELVVGDTTLPSGPSTGDEGPIIDGGQMWYNIGDIVDVNCTSPKSLHAAELKWYINDQDANHEYLILYPVTRDSSTGLEIAVLGLKFRVQKGHLRNTEMRLKCTAALSKVIRMSSEETVLDARRQTSGLVVIDNSQAAAATWDACEWLVMTLAISSHQLLR